MSFGPRHMITDEYGQLVEVNVEMGDGVVCLDVTGVKADDWPLTQRDKSPSTLTPDQADRLAAQLRAAATEARRYGRG